MMDLELAKHEIAHALGGLLCGASVATIENDGTSWVTTHQWPVENPPEFSVLAAHLAGPVLVPGRTSDDDRAVMTALYNKAPDDFARLAAFIVEVVGPELAEVDAKFIESVATRVAAGEAVHLRRKRSH